MENKIKKFFSNYPGIIVLMLLLINFLIRVYIYFNTTLFSFSDYSAYLEAVDKIASGEKQYLLEGNFLYAISYLGFFAKYYLGNMDWFFIFNCLTATLTGLIIYYLTKKITGSHKAGILTLLLLTFYTEYMVFSSVFYTPVLMIFFVSLILMFLYFFIIYDNRIKIILSGSAVILIYLLTFLFKPELKYLPWFLLVLSVFILKKYKIQSIKLGVLSLFMIAALFFYNNSGILTKPEGNMISNAFVFFGHTDYGGEGGEGSFIYPENEIRYEEAWKKYCNKNMLNEPTLKDRNRFQLLEIKEFITQHPLKWIHLQLTKFFRTFGVVPESTSFKVLYTGLLKGNLWLTSIIVVAPVGLIIMMFIVFFNFSAIKNLFSSSTVQPLNHSLSHQEPETVSPDHNKSGQVPNSNKAGFLYIYMMIFIYYIIATIFFGHYQERYRLSVMVIFLIPMLGYFIASFERKQFLNRLSLIIKSSVIVLFLVVWMLQAKNATSNKERFNNAMKSLIVSLK